MASALGCMAALGSTQLDCLNAGINGEYVRRGTMLAPDGAKLSKRAGCLGVVTLPW